MEISKVLNTSNESIGKVQLVLSNENTKYAGIIIILSLLQVVLTSWIMPMVEPKAKSNSPSNLASFNLMKEQAVKELEYIVVNDLRNGVELREGSKITMDEEFKNRKNKLFFHYRALIRNLMYCKDFSASLLGEVPDLNYFIFYDMKEEALNDVLTALQSAGESLAWLESVEQEYINQVQMENDLTKYVVENQIKEQTAELIKKQIEFFQSLFGGEFSLLNRGSEPNKKFVKFMKDTEVLIGIHSFAIEKYNEKMSFFKSLIVLLQIFLAVITAVMLFQKEWVSIPKLEA